MLKIFNENHQITERNFNYSALTVVARRAMKHEAYTACP